jgi:hypothetical protein
MNSAAANDTAALSVGETLEIPGFRVHCYVNSLVITELANAGKRGQTVRELVVLCKNPAGMAAAYLEILAGSGFDGAQDFAGECALGRLCEVDHRTLRGVDVPQAGCGNRNLRIGRFAILLGWDDFSIRDERDPNLGTVWGKGRADAAKVRAWVESSAAFIERMRLGQIETVLAEAGVKTKHFCGMD